MAAATGVPVAAICGATVGLAAEGLLDERSHTSNAAEVLAATGYDGADRYNSELAVTDGDLVTASAIAPVEFAREVFARLDLYEPEVLASWYKGYEAVRRIDPARGVFAKRLADELGRDAFEQTLETLIRLSAALDAVAPAAPQ